MSSMPHFKLSFKSEQPICFGIAVQKCIVIHVHSTSITCLQDSACRAVTVLSLI